MTWTLLSAAWLVQGMTMSQVIVNSLPGIGSAERRPLASGGPSRVRWKVMPLTWPRSSEMTSTGEETGQLEHMLSRTADFYEQRVAAAVDGLSSLVEPIAIVVLGGLVGVMLLALYLPIFNLGQAMRQGLVGH